MSEELWATPPSWTWATLDDVAQWSSGGTPKSGEPSYYGGSIPWLIIRDLNDGVVTGAAKSISQLGLENSSAKYVEPGAVMIALYGSIGKLGIASVRCTTNQAIAFTKSISEAVEQPFLFRYLQNVRGRLLELGKGVGQPNISQAILKAFPICVAPLAEQRRIVAKLESLLAKVDACRARLAKIPVLLKRFRQSVLAAACSGRLTADWREENPRIETATESLEQIGQRRLKAWGENAGSTSRRKHPEPKETDADDLPEIPASWLWVSAEAICSQITDGEHIQPPYQAEGCPMLSAKHVRDGFVTMENAGLISERDFKKALERCEPLNGDILIVSVGATTGRSAIVEDCSPFAIVRSVLLLKPLVSPKYLLRCLQNPWCFRWMTQASGASAQPHLYIKDTKRIPVPFAPLPEQQEIVRRVEALFVLADRLEARLAQARALVDKLTPALLARAFRGELVPTEAELARREGRSYEPASVLLDRIRAERAAEAPKPKSGRRAMGA